MDVDSQRCSGAGHPWASARRSRYRGGGASGARGVEALLARLDSLPALRLHVFGHIHEAYGSTELRGRRFVNACSCDVGYRPVNAPIVVDL